MKDESRIIAIMIEDWVWLPWKKNTEDFSEFFLDGIFIF